ncbi:MAG TPA: sulfite exporter TauE/SafE family protein, partial [Saprospiraceae bacterium]|nr:sulfite exporter TauE/SafE family protein [Saprospiraceae bacterium]
VFALGVLNGLLPCGMVYAALAGAISTTEAAGGALFMAVFGVGTLPLLLMLSVLGQGAGTWVRQRVRFLQPVLLAVAGLLLLQRGLHLDLSLFDSAVPKAGTDCH